MIIGNSTASDIEDIFSGPNLKRQLVEKEIADNRQWKMLSGDDVACIRATTFDDPQIWKERMLTRLYTFTALLRPCL